MNELFINSAIGVSAGLICIGAIELSFYLYDKFFDRGDRE